MSSIDRINKRLKRLQEEQKTGVKTSPINSSMDNINTYVNDLQNGGIKYEARKAVPYTVPNDIAPVKAKKEENKKWWQEFLQPPEAFKDNLRSLDDGFDWQDIFSIGGETIADTTKTILGTTADAGLSVVGGIGKVGEGIGDLLSYGGAQVLDWAGADDYANQVRKNASENLTDKLINKAKSKMQVEEHSILGKTSDKVADLVGYSVGLIYGGGAMGKAGNIPVGVAGKTLNVPTLAVVGGTSGGLQEAYSGETDPHWVQAWTKGLGSGAIEGVTEGLFGMFGVGGNEFTDQLGKNVANKFTSGIAKTLAKTGVQATGESIEEFLSYAGNQGLDLLIDKASGENNPNFHKDWNWEEVGEQMALAFLSGGITQGGGTVFNTQMQTNLAVNTAEKELGRALTKQEKADIKNQVTNAVINENTLNEQKVIDTIVNNYVTNAEAQGQTLNNKDIQKFTKQVRENLDNGELNTADIESALGDVTTSWGDTVTQISNLEQQLESTTNKSEQKNIKNQIKELQDNLKQDSRLQKSYYEKAQKGVTFQAEINDNTSDIRKGLYESATRSGVNNTTRNHNFIESVASIAEDTGTKYEFTTTEELKKSKLIPDNGNVPNGLIINGDKILVNIDSPKALNRILGHETTHLLEGTKEHRELREFTIRYAQETGDYDAKAKSVIEAYKGVKTNKFNELTNDLVSDYLFDTKFITELANQKPTTFQKVFNNIRNIYKKATAGSKEAKMLEELKYKYQKAYLEVVKNNKANKKANNKTTTKGTKDNSPVEAESNTKYSLSEVVDSLKGNKALNNEYQTEANKELNKKAQEWYNRELENHKEFLEDGDITQEDYNRFVEYFNNGDNVTAERVNEYSHEYYSEEAWNGLDNELKEQDNTKDNSIDKIIDALEYSHKELSKSFPKATIKVSKSSQSNSAYLSVETNGDTYKMRISDHHLPNYYDKNSGGYRAMQYDVAHNVNGKTTIKEDLQEFKDIINNQDVKYSLSNEQDTYIKKAVDKVENTMKQDVIDGAFIDEIIEESPYYKDNYIDEDSDIDIDVIENHNRDLYNKVLNQLEETLAKEGISQRYDKKTDKYVWDRQELAVKGYNELLDYLDNKNVSYEVSKSTEAGYVPSIYIKSADGDTTFRIANHENGYIDDFDMTYNDSYNKLFNDKDYANWKENIVPVLEKNGVLEDINMSLSNQNEDIAPIGNDNIYGKDIKVQGLEEMLAPLQEVIEDLSTKVQDLQEQLAPTNIVEDASKPEQDQQYAPVSQEVVEQQSTDSLDYYFNNENAIPNTEGTFTFNDDTNVDYKLKKDIVNDIRRNFSIKTKEAKDLYDKIANMEDATVNDVYEVLEDYRDIKLEEINYLKRDVKKVIRNTRIDASSLKNQITDYKDFLRSNFGNLRIAYDGQPVDVVYQELLNEYPSEFDASITNPADQLEYLSDYTKDDTVITQIESIDDEALYNLAERLYTDIGNRSRLNKATWQEHFFDKDLKKGEVPIPPNPYYAEPVLNASNTEKTQDIAPVGSKNAQANTNTLKGENVAKKGSNTINRDPLEIFLAREDTPAVTKSDIPKAKVKKESALKNAYELGVNRNYRIDKLAKDSGNQDIKYAGDMLNSVYGEVDGNINIAQTDKDGKIIGNSLKQLFANSKNRGYYDILNDYLLQYSNIERHAQGKGSAVPSEYSQEMVKMYESQYPYLKNDAKKIWQYGDNMLLDMKNNGLIDETGYNLLREMYPHYVPFMKDVDLVPYMADNGEIKPRKVIKTAEGGAKLNKLLSVEEALIKYTYAYKKAIRQNDLYKEIVNTLDDKADVGADARQDPTQLNESLYKDETGNYLTAYIDGKQQSVRISDELYRGLKNDIENTIRNLEERFARITNPLQKISEVRRNLLTTWSISFIINNPIKDIQDAVFNSKYTKDMMAYYPTAFHELNKQSTPEAKQFLALYGSGNTMGEFDIDNLTKNSKVENIKFIRKIAKFNDVVELAPRYAEFKASRKNGATIEEAMYNAREITTNFGRGGAITKALNRNGATFLNASVQGFDKFIRNFSGENGAKGVVGSLVKVAMFGILPAVFNHLAFGGDDEDEDYKALPDYIKDTYYLIKTDDGEFIRIPKGRMLSVFGMTARRMLEYGAGEEDAFEGLFKSASNQVSPNNPFTENIFSPLIQAFNNEAWYGGDIVSSRLQKMPTKEQYDEGTDKLSILLGQMFGISPAKLNYVIDQYSGGFGDMLLPLITEEAKSKGGVLAPLADKFTTDSITDNKYVSDIYSLSDELYKKSNSANATDEDKLKSQYIYAMTSEMGKLYAERRKVQNDDTLTKAEKYEKAQAIKKQINSIAEEGLNNYQNLTKTDNYAIISDKEYFKYHDKDTDTYKWYTPYEDELADLNSMGMDIDEKSTYYKAKEEISSIKDNARENEEEYAVTKQNIAETIINTNLTSDEKYYLYDRYYGSTETLDVIANIGVNADDYIMYDSQPFESDKDVYGEPISGSKKKKVFDYINTMNIDFEQKVILAKLKYKSYDEYNYEIIDYLNKSNITYEEEVNLLKKLGFDVFDDGTITWK